MTKIAGKQGGMEGTNKIVDLPAGGAAPASCAVIDVSGPTVTYVCITVAVDSYYTYAATAAAALTRLGSDDTRSEVPAGTATFPVGLNDGVMGFTNKAAVAVTGGLSYHLVKG